MNKIYRLDEDLRILYNNSNEIRLRLGMWNYNEAILDISSFSDEFKESIKISFSKMKSDKGLEVLEIENYNIKEEEKENLKQLLSELEQAGMIYDKKHLDIKEKINNVLLGNLTEAFIEEDRKDRRVLFVTDCDYSMETAKNICKEMQVELEFKGNDFISKVAKMDAVTNLDALTTEKSIQGISEEIKDYDAIAISLKHINMAFLRNINRAAIELKKPVTLGMIDGPFITVLSIKPPVTGCLECFENRILARLEDHVLYQKYVQNDFTSKGKINPSKILLSNMVTNLVLSEAVLLKNLGATKFEGRVLSVFIPTLEVQVQDLLRVPYCPACGSVAKAKFEEMNVKSRVIVDKILKTIDKK